MKILNEKKKVNDEIINNISNTVNSNNPNSMRSPNEYSFALLLPNLKA